MLIAVSLPRNQKNACEWVQCFLVITLNNKVATGVALIISFISQLVLHTPISVIVRTLAPLALAVCHSYSAMSTWYVSKFTSNTTVIRLTLIFKRWKSMIISSIILSQIWGIRGTVWIYDPLKAAIVYHCCVLVWITYFLVTICSYTYMLSSVADILLLVNMYENYCNIN